MGDAVAEDVPTDGRVVRIARVDLAQVAELVHGSRGVTNRTRMRESAENLKGDHAGKRRREIRTRATRCVLMAHAFNDTSQVVAEHREERSKDEITLLIEGEPGRHTTVNYSICLGVTQVF